MVYFTPASLKAASRKRRSSFSQRADDALSGSSTAMLPSSAALLVRLVVQIATVLSRTTNESTRLKVLRMFLSSIIEYEQQNGREPAECCALSVLLVVGRVVP